MLETIHGFVWGAPALVLILGVGIYLSVRTGFAQLRMLPRAFYLFGKKLTEPSDKEGVSPFQALCTALAATVGTGNLAGVAGAIALGGPGAIFWMWICGILGMITKLAEASLAVHFRVSDGSGGFLGGPMYMIRQGMSKHWHFMASVYCFFGVVASLGVGNATQIHTLVASARDVVCWLGREPGKELPWILGLILATATFVLLSGGGKKIGSIAERLVPVASVCYILLCLLVLILRCQAIPDAFASILKGAFSPKAVTGGAIGSAFLALRTGVARGVFTNEAGMGTASIAHAAADVSHPVEQGLMGCIEVFLDTIVICTMTALVILCSGVAVPYGQDTGIALTTQAFSGVFGNWVSIPIACFICCFAFATLIGWGFYGIRCAQYLFGTRIYFLYACLQGITALVSATLETKTVWLISEIINGMMSVPNLIAVIALSPILIRLIKEYRGHCALCISSGLWN